MWLFVMADAIGVMTLLGEANGDDADETDTPETERIWWRGEDKKDRVDIE